MEEGPQPGPPFPSWGSGEESGAQSGVQGGKTWWQRGKRSADFLGSWEGKGLTLDEPKWKPSFPRSLEHLPPTHDRCHGIREGQSLSSNCASSVWQVPSISQTNYPDPRSPPCEQACRPRQTATPPPPNWCSGQGSDSGNFMFYPVRPGTGWALLVAPQPRGAGGSPPREWPTQAPTGPSRAGTGAGGRLLATASTARARAGRAGSFSPGESQTQHRACRRQLNPREEARRASWGWAHKTAKSY